jgi:hypothetical protein
LGDTLSVPTFGICQRITEHVEEDGLGEVVDEGYRLPSFRPKLISLVKGLSYPMLFAGVR